MSNPTSYSWTAVVDALAPTIAMVDVLDSVTIRIFFSEAVVESEASNLANYSFDNGLQAIEITRENGFTYLMTTSTQTAGQSYTITASNIHDVNGNLI